MAIISSLLIINNDFDLPGFANQRKNAMVALAACSAPSITYLAKEFYGTNRSLAQRLDILEVLEKACMECSKAARVRHHTTPASSGSSRPAPTDEGRAPPHAAPGNADAAFVAGKTRRWGYALHPRKDAGAPVGPVQMGLSEAGEGAGTSGAWSAARQASRGWWSHPQLGPPLCFFSLVGGLESRMSPTAAVLVGGQPSRQVQASSGAVAVDMFGDDHLLLGRLLATLGTVLEAAALHPAADRMAAALVSLVMLPAVRFHSHAYVRRCALLALSRVVVALRPEVICTDFSELLDEWRQWLLSVHDGDADEQARDLAVSILLLLKDRLSGMSEQP